MKVESCSPDTKIPFVESVWESLQDAKETVEKEMVDVVKAAPVIYTAPPYPWGAVQEVNEQPERVSLFEGERVVQITDPFRFAFNVTFRAVTLSVADAGDTV